MTFPSTIAHGGALAIAIKTYGGEKHNWIDLSTGINPVAPSLPKIAMPVWQALPDSDLMDECLAAARQFYGFSPLAEVVAAPGIQALIQLLPHLRNGAKAAILGPTYGEYAHVFQQLGSGCRIISSIDDVSAKEVIIIVNPNNPDGRIVDPGQLMALAEKQAQTGGLLIVDEAFSDMMPELSVANHAGTRGLLVLKSFGKFFGLAGLRLGFAAGCAEDISILQERLGPWAVSGPALAAGAACYADVKSSAKIFRSVLHRSNRQRAVLSGAGLKVIADVGLFHLIEHDKASVISNHLARCHILTRIFADNPLWLRIGLCKNAAERERLADALQSCLRTL